MFLIDVRIRRFHSLTGRNSPFHSLGDKASYQQLSWCVNSLSESSPIRLRADFNGLFSQVLCLSHNETCVGENGQDVTVYEGMIATAFDEDVDDDGKPDNLVASGIVERSPAWLRGHGSRWVLKIDQNGV